MRVGTMKTQRIKVTAKHPNKFPGMPTSSIRALLVALFIVTSTPVLAVDAVWASAPGSGDWNTNSIWIPDVGEFSIAPVLPGDRATFNTSTIISLTLSAAVTVESITFNPTASAFTIETNGNVLKIQGAGIMNKSGTTEMIIDNGEGEGTNRGITIFLKGSTADNLRITNDGAASTATAIGAGGGLTQFFSKSNAGSATIVNNGSSASFTQGGLTQFFDTSSAGNAAITNNGLLVTDAQPGSTDLDGTSTAGSARITNNGAAIAGAGGITVFQFASSAGSATITNNGGTGSSGLTEFSDTSSAGNATIINNVGGVTEFFRTSSAGNATIINNAGGVTAFLDTSNAENAMIMTNGGGTTRFLGSSEGGIARAVTNGSGRFDISGLTGLGMGIGSIEGSGNYFLGSKTLTVGGNNLSTAVSGIIQDGGINGGTGGSLTKVGTRTLTLTGANTYTGTTTVNGGSLIVDGTVESAQTLVNASGLLGGRGFLGGNLLNSGIVSPGDSPGTLHVSGNYNQSPTGTLRIEVAGTTQGQFDLLAIGGHASLGGTLQLIPLNGFQLHVGDKVTFLTANGGVSGNFSAIQNEVPTIVKTQIVIFSNPIVLERTPPPVLFGASIPK